MDLYIFPEGATLTNGYGIAVEYAYNKLQPKVDDIVIWYTDLPKEKILHYRESDIIIPRFGWMNIKSIKNILMSHPRVELNAKDLSFLLKYDIENIHCDEVIFYRALRSLYPSKKLNIRFHNSYSRINCRRKIVGIKIDCKFWLTLNLFDRLEREIFRDENCNKIFLTDEDRSFYTSLYGKTSDSEVWPFIPNVESAINSRRKETLSHKLVWYGGIESHKKASVEWFIRDVYPQVKSLIPDVEFHLWGKGSELYNDVKLSIYGHGKYMNDDLPEKNSLYVNPDIIGGGIKLKLMSLIENGAPFISSVFGYEGYPKSLIDDYYIIVKEDNDWVKSIVDIFLNKS